MSTNLYFSSFQNDHQNCSERMLVTNCTKLFIEILIKKTTLGNFFNKKYYVLKTTKLKEMLRFKYHGFHPITFIWRDYNIFKYWNNFTTQKSVKKILENIVLK